MGFSIFLEREGKCVQEYTLGGYFFLLEEWRAVRKIEYSTLFFSPCLVRGLPDILILAERILKLPFLVLWDVSLSKILFQPSKILLRMRESEFS